MAGKIKIAVIPIIGFVLQLLRLLRNNGKTLQKQNLLNIVRMLSAWSPTELISNFQKLEDIGLCYGRLFSPQKCASLFSAKKNVIVSKLYEINSWRTKGEYQSLRKLVQTKRPPFFVIHDKFSSVPVYETTALNIRTTKVSKTVYRANISNFWISLINFFRDRKIPYIADKHFQERYLPEGAEMAILGKFKKEPNSGKIICEKPIAMASSKNRLINDIEVKIFNLNVEKFALIFGMGLCLGWVLRLLFNEYKRYANMRKLDEQMTSKIFVKSRACGICKQKVSDMILMPCGHLNMCVGCSKENKICLECKKVSSNCTQLFAC